MKVNCENCEAILNLDDSKLPPGRDFSFNCPKCKHKNTIDVPPYNDPPQDDKAIKSTASDGKKIDMSTSEEEIGDSDFFEEGSKPALICFNEGPLCDKIENVSRAMGFAPVVPTSAAEAHKKLKLTQFNMILLEETFGGKSLKFNALLSLMQQMETSIRRRIFVALFSKKIKTLDQMSAFALSVNLTVSLGDDDQFDKILKRGYAEYRRFYKVYFDVMREIGKV